jgi:cytochrome c oxidase subunit IV
MESATNWRKKFDLEAKLDWFTIGIITLPKLGILVTIVMSLEFDNDDLSFVFHIPLMKFW